MPSPWARALLDEPKTVTLTSEGRNDYGPAWPQKLEVAGGDAIAYGIFTVPAGEAQRRTQGGPDVPGPWADLWGHATVIDGTRHVPGIAVRPGDRLILDGVSYTVALSDGVGGKGTRGWVRRGYPLLLTDEEVGS